MNAPRRSMRCPFSPAESRKLRRQRVLRHEYKLAHLAHRTRAAFAERNVMRTVAHGGRRMRNRHGETATDEDRKVRQGVADVSACGGRQAQLAAELIPRRQLVHRALDDMHDAERLRAIGDRRRVAAAHSGDGTAAPAPGACAREGAAGGLLPVIQATVTPASASILMPTPSSEENAFISLP